MKLDESFEVRVSTNYYTYRAFHLIDEIEVEDDKTDY